MCEFLRNTLLWFRPVACAAAARQLDPKLLRPTAAARSSVRPNCNIKICVISTLMITAAAADAVLRVTVIVVVLPVVVNVVVFVAVSVEAATVVVAIVAVVVLVVVDLDVVVVDGVTGGQLSTIHPPPISPQRGLSLVEASSPNVNKLRPWCLSMVHG